MKFSDITQFTNPGDWEVNYSIERFVNQIGEWINEEKLEMNPDFQRGHVWTEEQQIKFIEFILQGGITGRVIYLNHPQWTNGSLAKEGEFVCVDGLQRYTALKRFINNEIKAFDFLYSEFEGRSGISNGMKININSLKTRTEVLKWYLEINNEGTPHTEEELNRVSMLLEKELKTSIQLR